MRGMLPMPDPDLAADMYEWVSDYLEGQGYEQYEISNWARPGFQCRHNLQYWRNEPYLGFGAGAHGCANGLRISNVLRIKTYIEHMTRGRQIPAPTFPITPATVTQTHITRRVEMQETLMLGLRLTRTGVSGEAFQARFGAELPEVFGNEIDELVKLDLLEWVKPVAVDLTRVTTYPAGTIAGQPGFHEVCRRIRRPYEWIDRACWFGRVSTGDG